MSTSTDSAKVFRPRTWRILVLQILPVVLLILALIAIAGVIGFVVARNVTRPIVRSMSYVVIAIVFPAASAWQGRRGYRIKMSADTMVVYQPRPLTFFQREQEQLHHVFTLSDLDRRRSAERSLKDRLLGRHRIYSIHDTQITLKRRIFSPADFQRLLGMLNIRE